MNKRAVFLFVWFFMGGIAVAIEGAVRLSQGDNGSAWVHAIVFVVCATLAGFNATKVLEPR